MLPDGMFTDRTQEAHESPEFDKSLTTSSNKITVARTATIEVATKPHQNMQRAVDVDVSPPLTIRDWMEAGQRELEVQQRW